jgi:hypothetical protein
MQQADRGHLQPISDKELSAFWRADRLPNPQLQADNLVVWIGDHQPTQLDFAAARAAVIEATVGLPLSVNGEGSAWGWLNTQLKDSGLYHVKDAGGGLVGLRLTLTGWARYEALKKASPTSRTAFMAMKFNDATLDRVVSQCFKPAVAQSGFELRLLTDEQPAGIIDNQLRAAILSARFLVADLTHGSYGAYWEAGFAEGLGLPVIYTCEASHWKKAGTHFDTNHLVTIIWEESDLERAGRLLAATIRATLRAEAKLGDAK